MATQEDRSLSSGMFFPKWMKNKMNDRFDLDQNTFSPTELDDSFMYYYQHPLKSNSSAAKNEQAIKVDGNMTDTKVVKAGQATSTTKVDFSQSALASYARGLPKSKGTDDGFKGETAQVGSSVVRVANQIVSGRSIPEDSIPEPVQDCEQLLAKFDPYRRRGSRSLPASPLQSPKSARKINNYFTSPYTEGDKSKGWILSSLLAKREISQSMSLIGEEKKEELDRAGSFASVDDLSSNGKTAKTQVFKAKPSELREMNFWSPTSM